jgi:molybdopterin-containing oxidoreductase family iron-sulfur binding subunit
MPQVNELPGKRQPQAVDRRPAMNRRQALGLLAAGISSGLAACSRPAEQIIPYVDMPERLVPGEALKFATTLPLSGYGRGAIVTSIDGRPIKVEGNPRHPASLGATDVFAEAAVLSLYDPDRSRTVLHDGAIASHEAFRLALRNELQQMKASSGDGFRVLTQRTTSPTLLRQIGELLQRYPGARWHAHDPLDQPDVEAGSMLAFGKPLQVVARLEAAVIIVALDADPLGPGPDQIRHARGFAAHRRPGDAAFSRLYAFESAPTLTGAKADHRIALHPDGIAEVAVALAAAQGAAVRDAVLPDHARAVVAQIVKDLASHHGAALIVCGPGLPAETHALVHWLNARLQAPLELMAQVPATPQGTEPRPLSDLVQDLRGGAVQQLIMLGVNPAYDTPADLEFASHAKTARFRVHVGCYADETADLASWHVPQSHVLETWSDLRASDGTASLVQPLIRPLYDTLSDHEVLALLSERSDAKGYDIVRETWRGQAGADFDGWWSQALHDGVIANSASTPLTPGEPTLPTLAAAPAETDGLSLVLRPDPCVWDGTFANNAWLQECPKPLTKQVWGNVLALHPKDARRLGVNNGDIVTIAAGARQVEAPVLLEPGMALGVAAITLGMGRRQAGAIGNGVGADAYALRSTKTLWHVPDISLSRTGRREEILTTQNVVRAEEEVRELYPVRQLSQQSQPIRPQSAQPKPSLLPDRPKPDDGHAWAMVIDASVCIGCNACVVACQAENNVPVVGPEEVARGRDMHWLRVDVYDHGRPEAPRLGFQPVPCMHCEHAPCEPVCPVAASVHDGEGLNVQVYNRCVGTRFCEANCPYKVRRFNFFGYADGEEYANLGRDSYRGQKNPEVTVRARGVMEKCTYCVQRISAARRTAERENRPIGIDEVQTACQTACPTRAISFGDLAQPESAIHRQRAEPRGYALLEHLGTRPRTTYLADIRNPAPGIGGDGT